MSVRPSDATLAVPPQMVRGARGCFQFILRVRPEKQRETDTQGRESKAQAGPGQAEGVASPGVWGWAPRGDGYRGWGKAGAAGEGLLGKPTEAGDEGAAGAAGTGLDWDLAERRPPGTLGPGRRPAAHTRASPKISRVLAAGPRRGPLATPTRPLTTPTRPLTPHPGPAGKARGRESPRGRSSICRDALRPLGASSRRRFPRAAGPASSWGGALETARLVGGSPQSPRPAAEA
ncbi:unnamed protein product [Rangifer tarandus platyrhynchus]|uniref:Uncharacterized protein n=1 Tax=Rangifer tarandus platyrhynchus TaxID=3082113 RepID=A0ABN8ZQ64_RANTA|nr:unnamed protein product [Rangifer tarandus platyrhynchus]